MTYFFRLCLFFCLNIAYLYSFFKILIVQYYTIPDQFCLYVSIFILEIEYRNNIVTFIKDFVYIIK